MHLDTVMTMVDRDVVTRTRPSSTTTSRSGQCDRGDGQSALPVVEPFDGKSSRRSSTRSGSSGIRVIPTGGDSSEMAREQWDDGNNVVCLEPGVVVAYERNVDTNTCSARRASR